jgi:hypothetical protein
MVNGRRYGAGRKLMKAGGVGTTWPLTEKMLAATLLLIFTTTLHCETTVMNDASSPTVDLSACTGMETVVSLGGCSDPGCTGRYRTHAQAVSRERSGGIPGALSRCSAAERGFDLGAVVVRVRFPRGDRLRSWIGRKAEPRQRGERQHGKARHRADGRDPQRCRSPRTVPRKPPASARASPTARAANSVSSASASTAGDPASCSFWGGGTRQRRSPPRGWAGRASRRSTSSTAPHAPRHRA